MPSVVAKSSMASSKDALSKRRRFQPSITNYFSTAPSEPYHSDGHTVSHNHYAAATFSATPVVPSTVQSSLLSVGMRVRKSVADGYKTQEAMEKEKAFAIPAVAETSTAQPYLSGTRSAELAPFSGTFKLYEPSTSCGHLITDDGDAFSLPPSSQESVQTTNSFSTMNHQKRTFDSDDVFADSGDEANDGPRETPLGRHILAPGLGPQRRRMLAAQRMSSQATMDLDDFEEASFLRRREEVDADYGRMDFA
ncbi:hypothetical protein N7532_006934 [Penicillium argentinense]|uniref:Uncharacterized protein n=1 Tax=Penicillium argentinense TaxID=1131581 RepID=A0A9W9FGV4_9EURO|nr:uncharacterized protein N7532_006934 [Penicillium argentinense]KAJ5099933.1 hypothetical protein N7532_006934 [Penicillium argentinense]